ncbi:hypothetical protein R6Q57_008309 [Mikania cordata]
MKQDKKPVVEIQMGNLTGKEKIKMKMLKMMIHLLKRSHKLFGPIDLHRKFVDAVNQLGIESELFNTHKYRLYLKRMSQQQANMVVAFGSSKEASS